ncbi:hypothetical protein MNBD_ALPHA01-1797 [hydrothermal vent metagenome]|uniref:NnrU domain-containing protein n=1 Tax=hydrothermal vent metagenome TaxID=652676 RepID=A0A3B0S710_9ZZZZ
MSIILYIGVFLFCLIHLFPAAFSGSRQGIVEKIGEKPFKGIFSLLTVLSIVVIVIGWRSSEADVIFDPPEWGRMVTPPLMLLTFFLFISLGNIKRLIRHPQLSSVILWAVAHLLSNGDSRSVALFSSLAIWAAVDMYFLNRRDGKWQKPDVVPFSADVKAVLIALVIYIGVSFAHVYISGVPLAHS